MREGADAEKKGSLITQRASVRTSTDQPQKAAQFQVAK
jgi:hypothetical protein